MKFIRYTAAAAAFAAAGTTAALASPSPSEASSPSSTTVQIKFFAKTGWGVSVDSPDPACKARSLTLRADYGAGDVRTVALRTNKLGRHGGSVADYFTGNFYLTASVPATKDCAAGTSYGVWLTLP